MRKLKPILSLILALAMMFSCFAAFAADSEEADDEEESAELVTEFSDIDKSTMVGKAVTDLAMRGIVAGYEDGTFMPEGSITRAEFAIICTRLSGLADSVGTDAVTGFSDLDGDDSYKWARPYVHMASGQGIITGFDDGTFRPADPVTYEQAIKMLMCLLKYGDISEAKTEDLQKEDSTQSWSSGYIFYANQTGLLQNMTMDLSYTQAINRGQVAILAYNSLSIPTLEKTVSATGTVTYTTSGSKNNGGGGGGGGSGSTLNSNLETSSGVVTATYITSLDSQTNDLGKYEIMIGDDIYEVDSTVLNKLDLNEILGQKIKITYNKKEDLITAISTNYVSTTLISTGVREDGKFLLEIGEDGKIYYSSNPDTYKSSSVSLSGYNVIFNGKYIEDFNPADLADEESPYYFTNGTIELITSGKYKTAKICNYKTYVIKSITSTTSSGSSSSKLTILYKSGSERVLEFPEAESGEYFMFRRGSTEIESSSDLAAYDVLNIMQSPEDVAGTDVRIIEVSRSSKTSATVTGLGEYDSEKVVEIGGKYYQYNYDYLNYNEEAGTDTKYELKTGDTGVSVYFDFVGQIAAVAMNTTSTTTSYKYGYLLDVGQDKNEKSLEFYIIDENGSDVVHEGYNKVVIDGTSYAKTNTSIPEMLLESAELANAAYIAAEGEAVTNQAYQQPIRYKLNTNGYITAIDTVAESDIDDEDLTIGSVYSGTRSPSGSNGTFNDFTVSDSYTKVIYVPDDRANYSGYEVMSSPASNFTVGRSYYVEALNLESSSSSRPRAKLVLVYKTNDSLTYNYKTPFMIVTNVGIDIKNDVYTLTGFYCQTSTVSTTTTGSNCTYNISGSVSSSLVESIGKGDIVRFLLDSDGEINDLQIWLDASDPAQAEPVSSIEEAVEKRITAYSQTTDGDPDSGDVPTAPFRLAYGLVYSHIPDDKAITVTPTLPGDDLEISDNVTGAVSHYYSTATKLFVYNGSKDGPEYLGTTSSTEFDVLSSYTNVGDAASVVVTYTTGTTTSISNGQVRFIYIITL